MYLEMLYVYMYNGYRNVMLSVGISKPNSFLKFSYKFFKFQFCRQITCKITWNRFLLSLRRDCSYAV